jgi:hypothetical protein
MPKVEHYVNKAYMRGEWCRCGTDTVVCQGCGQLVCGSSAKWVELGLKADNSEVRGNVGPCCIATLKEAL